MKPTITIAAIAKNEERYLEEWIAFHLAAGADRIIIYSNDSQDGQLRLLNNIGVNEPRVTGLDWPSPAHDSPQVSAYRAALNIASTEWIAFIDIDEFLVPAEHDDLPAYLETVPDDISSIHVNWRNFGSGGLRNANYELVTRTFVTGASHGWGNHYHFKSLGRREHVKRISIHNIETFTGRRTLSDFTEFHTEHDGLSDRVVHHPLRIHHYQCKTPVEFAARMQRGDANFPPDHPDKNRDGSLSRFAELDLNEVFDDSIRRFDAKLDAQLLSLRSTISL